MQPGTGGCVLQVNLRFGIEMPLHRKRYQRRLVKPAEDEFLLAWINNNVADGKYPRDVGLKLLDIYFDLILDPIQPPLCYGPEFRRQTIEHQQMIENHSLLDRFRAQHTGRSQVATMSLEIYDMPCRKSASPDSTNAMNRETEAGAALNFKDR